MNVDDKGYGGVFAFVMNVMENINPNHFILDIAACEPFEKKSHIERINKIGGKVFGCYATGNFLFKQFHTCRKLYALIKEAHYSVIHIHSDVAYKLLLYGWVAKFAGGRQIIVHSHSTGVEGRYRTLKLTLQKLAKPVLSWQNFVFLACSGMAASWMYESHLLPKVRIIQNGIPISKFRYDSKKADRVRKELGVGPDEKVLGTVARFSYQKNPERLLEIFCDLLRIDENYRLLWVGTGPLQKSIKDKAKDMGIEKKIIFYGNSDHVENLYAAMDVFVLTSRFEGLGIVLIEAQAAGLPCVVSDAVPKQVQCIDEVRFLSLQEETRVWCEAIEEYGHIPRSAGNYSVIQKRGYDIMATVNALEKLYQF